MSTPRVVVIPFGVPAEGRGLGLGLAALVHASAHLEGSGIALAQLEARRSEEGGPAPPPGPVEAFVPPAAWRDMARNDTRDATDPVSLVLTGAFEPPTAGQGTIRLLAFDSRDGRTRARVEAPVDEERAGATVVGAFEKLWAGIGGDLGALQGLRDLDWEPLESVLRAERCALHDPARGGPHDPLAAMLHFGRAIEDAPEARYAVERLSVLALEAIAGAKLDAKVIAAAVRALERAVEDAPGHVELVESLSALLLRLGRPREAERRINEVLAITKTRSRAYSILSHALRAQGKLDEALAALDDAIRTLGDDPTIHAERGVVLAERGDPDAAVAAWREALAREPVHAAAFGALATHVLRTGDAVLGPTLVDAALAATRAHVDVMRRAVELAVRTETEGLARAARIAKLCERVLGAFPDDPPMLLAHGRALVALGDAAGARARIAHVLRVAPASSAGAEAMVIRLSLDDPAADRDLQSVARAARSAAVADLADVAARARRLATLHGAWTGWVAAAIAERRRSRWQVARAHLESALEAAKGAVAVHLEMVEVLLHLEPESEGAREHAKIALTLEGETLGTLSALARALDAAGQRVEARRAAARAVALRPDDQDARALAESLRGDRAPRGWAATWKERAAALWHDRRK
ncbi:MAG TPA: tetratricopeptide repeat protein [Polyangiaceae bacterium]|jgi:tetratricopeptide (TPR) repeat protein|nr:tetratricopeptide repeat protein [Polyangiaceae bacterium]